MKVLVTGGAGFIGSHVVDLLLQSGLEPVVVDHYLSGARGTVPKEVRTIEMDITSPQIEGVFQAEKPDVVIHLAAQVDVAKSIQNPVEDAHQNILGTIRLLMCCQKFSVKKFIFSSSCAVYGETEDCSIQETFPIRPQSFYGISKYTSERYIQIFNSLHHVPYTILRYANVYGPRQTSKGEGAVVTTFFRKMLNGETPFIFGDGEQTRDFVYVKDVAMANVLSIEKGTNEIFNIGCNSKTSINELFQSVASLASFSISPNYMPERAGDIRYSRLDHSKARAMLDWQPSFDLHNGLMETLSYYKSM